MANQHTSQLVGIERPWADAVAGGAGHLVDELLAPHAQRAKRRSIMAWLREGAPYDFATPASISHWRRTLAAAGEPPHPLNGGTTPPPRPNGSGDGNGARRRPPAPRGSTDAQAPIRDHPLAA